MFAAVAPSSWPRTGRRGLASGGRGARYLLPGLRWCASTADMHLYGKPVRARPRPRAASGGTPTTAASARTPTVSAGRRSATTSSGPHSTCWRKSSGRMPAALLGDPAKVSVEYFVSCWMRALEGEERRSWDAAGRIPGESWSRESARIAHRPGLIDAYEEGLLDKGEFRAADSAAAKERLAKLEAEARGACGRRVPQEQELQLAIGRLAERSRSGFGADWRRPIGQRGGDPVRLGERRVEIDQEEYRGGVPGESAPFVETPRRGALCKIVGGVISPLLGPVPTCAVSSWAGRCWATRRG